MKTIFSLTLALFTSFIFANNTHTIIKQNGEKLEVNYVMTKDNTVYYSLLGNTSMNEISTFAVEKLIDNSNNQVLIENVKLDISGKEGYKNVQFVASDKTNGLKQQTELTTAIHKAKGESRVSWEEKAELRIKKQASEQGFPFVVIVSKTDSKITAIGYSY